MSHAQVGHPAVRVPDHHYDHIYVAGQWVSPATTARTEIVSPSTEEVVAVVPSCGPAEVDIAVSAAVTAYDTWSLSSPRQRGEVLRTLHTLCTAAADELAQLIHLEMGSPLDFARQEQVGTPLAIIADLARIAEEGAAQDDEVIGSSLVVKEPVGVVAAILPWNYPLYQLVAKVIPAIAAGCTVVAKPSEMTPLSTYRFTELLHDAGLPAGVFNLVPGTGVAVGQALAGHPAVDMVSFTGSTRAGSIVAQTAAPTVKRVALELGGKSASIVLPGADLDQAVRHSVDYCMTNSGQCCNAWTRLLVPRPLLAAAERIAADQAATVEPTLGPLISQRQFDTVQDYIAQGLAQGARLVHGGPGRVADARHGTYARATVFSDVTPDMTIAREEIFGPVLVIHAYDTVDEAVAIANDSVYGLHGGVWAESTEEALAVARRIRTGQIDVNGAGFNVAAPFGGFKQSGNGRELGRHGIEEFYELKSVQLP